jgi:glycosyltransferase involved in cell wall biosynthesis
MEKAKVLCIIQLPPPLHGVSTMNAYIVESEIINRKFQLDIVDLRFADSMDQLQSFSMSKAMTALKFIFVIVRRMRVFKPQMVYFTINPTGFAFYRDAVYVFFLKLFNAKIILHLHGKGIKPNAKSFFKKQLYKYVFNKTYVICLSERLTDDISDIYKSRPFIVPNGIQVQPYFERKPHIETAVEPQILCLSNYTRNKGILILVEALGLLKKKGLSFNARFVGAPFDLTAEMIEERAAELGLSKSVKAVGPLYGKEKYKEFENADIFVFPTYNDVFGLVNLEAMQYSLPVVSTFEGSIPDVVIDNETGLLAERQNVQMLAEKIEVLLNDKALRTEMGEKGYTRFINNYTLDRFITNLDKAFEHILLSP